MTSDMDGDETRGDLLLDHGDGAEVPPWAPVAEPTEDPAARAARERLVRTVVDWVVVGVCTVFVFSNLHPSLLLSSAVPAGGDMGAHVWGPAFLRDHLLPDGRLSGWTPDWYAGFPAYQFYMVLPSLLIVALDVGLLGGWLMVVPLAIAAALVAKAAGAGAGWARWAWAAGALIVLVGGVELPYGTAFKLVTVLGVVTLPAACYAFGRLAGLPFPGPPLLAVGAVFFLFDRNFTIYGGNVASTLAGEFAFSISLSLAVVYLGVVVRGLRTGRHRALAAGLLALTGLCHLIPAFYALAGTAVIAVLRRPVARTFWWLASVLPVAGLLSAFWVLPFFWQRALVNDMGWEKIPYAQDSNGQRSLADTLFSFGGETYWKYLVPTGTHDDLRFDLRWVLILAGLGLLLSVAFRVRVGWYLAAFALLGAVAFVALPDGQRLWNARILPFYYLSVYLLAAVGASEVGRTIAVFAARDPDRPSIVPGVVTAGVGLVVGLVLVALPLRTLPFGDVRADGSYSWFGLANGPGQGSFVGSWARWNYSGYEGKDAYAEYRDLMLTMEQVGEDHGCGRSLWEYEKDLNRYGTPMALMLLPHFTDGCIGSMEGLFFEASATTPFHFLMQTELSAAPSSAQRDLPYDGFDIDAGVQHLQLMGVRYYLTTSPQATTAARAHPDLTEVASSGPWVVFLVDDSELVEPVDYEPAVLDGVDQHQDGWLCGERDDRGRCYGPAVAWFEDPSAWDVLLAASGPDSWQRVDPDDPQPDRRPVPAAVVSNVEVGDERISFDVDEPGTPVLVKVSYFPNWHASGAEGPYRVAPNLMVVVPSDEHVVLSYEREPVEWVAIAMTVLGLGLLVVLAALPPLRVRRRDEGWTPAPPPGPPAHLTP